MRRLVPAACESTACATIPAILDEGTPRERWYVFQLGLDVLSHLCITDQIFISKQICRIVIAY